MKKIKISHDLYVPGYGTILKDTAFKVVKYNSRFVYVYISDYTTLRLARKADCVKVY